MLQAMAVEGRIGVIFMLCVYNVRNLSLQSKMKYLL
jgi:hypothetical protein